MGPITGDMKEVIEAHRIGYVASVSPDGTPNLSPKATMLVLDDRHIAFGELRSPNTIRNIASNPSVEVNFVDIFARKGYRFKGEAAFLARDSEAFDALLPAFSAWGELCEHFGGIVKILVHTARPLISPAYDHGATEGDLRAEWRAHFLDQ